jgi:UPF0755 protein
VSTIEEAGPPEVEPPPPRHGPAHRIRGRRRWPAVLAVVLVVMLLAGGVGLVWVRRQVSPGGQPGPAVSLTIPSGSSTKRIASLLGRAQVIRSPGLFTWYIRLKGGGPFEAGDYTFLRHSGYAAALSVLGRGPAVTFSKITIPEGFTMAQIAARVGKLPGRSADRFLAAAQSGQVQSRYSPPGSTALEGLLYPATYTLNKDEDEVSILRRMVAAFDQTASSLGLDQAAARLGISPYQVVVVASMVEREAKLDEDRGPVASVIYNRLRINMPLGIDSALLYGLHSSALTKADLASNSPYNLRKAHGLPPTPIASPGTPSLTAAMSPPATSFLYYVLIDAGGKQGFGVTAADFEKLKAEAKAKGLLGP